MESTQVTRGVVDEMLRRSALGAATLPLALLERFAKLDDPWAVAIARSEAAGRRLADLLMGPGDDGPATLVGYGAGARRSIVRVLSVLTITPAYRAM